MTATKAFRKSLGVILFIACLRPIVVSIAHFGWIRQGFLVKPATRDIRSLKGILPKPRRPVTLEAEPQHCPNGPRAVIGLDANVIVRYLAQDDARQAAAATRSF
jgi:hypothetical protein